MSHVFLALGSNLGDRHAALEAARKAIAALPQTRLLAMSPVYETAPVGGPAGQASFLNAAVEVETQLSPEELLISLQTVESEAGRESVQTRQRWGPRVLDIDILLYDRRIVTQPGLKIPHPRMHDRWFVLRPLSDLAPDLEHPILHRTVRSLLADVSQPEP